MTTRRIFRSSLTCRICGDVARGLNFDVITCMSCKAFFRRNALRPSGSLQCAYDDECHINKESRMRCSACRLKKCFTYGMKPQLIRSYHLSSTTEPTSTDTMIVDADWHLQLPMPQPLNLLQNDRSQMSSDQWTLISNIVHAYDTQNHLLRIRIHLENQLALPMKLRYKTSFAINFITDTAQTLASFIKKSPQFQSLPFDTRRKLMKNNLYLSNCINRMLIHREIDLINNDTFIMSFHRFYGPILFARCVSFLKKIELNGIFFKVFLFVLIFSSNSSILMENTSMEMISLSDYKSIFELQNLYVTLLWKYLIYQYGQTEAILRYATLIKIILDMHNTMEIMFDDPTYYEMVKQIEEMFLSDN